MTLTDTILARLRADTRSERIGLFLGTTEGDMGSSGQAVNERGELFGWWLFPDGRLNVRPYDADKLTEDDRRDPEFCAARAEVGLDW